MPVPEVATIIVGVDLDVAAGMERPAVRVEGCKDVTQYMFCLYPAIGIVKVNLGSVQAETFSWSVVDDGQYRGSSGACKICAPAISLPTMLLALMRPALEVAISME